MSLDDNKAQGLDSLPHVFKYDVEGANKVHD